MKLDRSGRVGPRRAPPHAAGGLTRGRGSRPRSGPLPSLRPDSCPAQPRGPGTDQDCVQVLETQEWRRDCTYPSAPTWSAATRPMDTTGRRRGQSWSTPPTHNPLPEAVRTSSSWLSPSSTSCAESAHLSTIGTPTVVSRGRSPLPGPSACSHMGRPTPSYGEGPAHALMRGPEGFVPVVAHGRRYVTCRQGACGMGQWGLCLRHRCVPAGGGAGCSSK